MESACQCAFRLFSTVVRVHHLATHDLCLVYSQTTPEPKAEMSLQHMSVVRLHVHDSGSFSPCLAGYPTEDHVFVGHFNCT